jgi:hypothetical protein
MADRYQGRPFPADDDHNRRADPHASARAEGDPLAELARLIGQTDPFAATMGRANQTVQPRGGERDQYQRPVAPEQDIPAAGPPPWMQRAARAERQQPPPVPPQHDYPNQDEPAQDYASQEYSNQDYSNQDYPSQEYPSAVHPLHRYATPRAPAVEPSYHEAPSFADTDHEPDPSRYDEALYGQVDTAAQQEPQYSEAYADDPYGYQDGYDDGLEEEQPRKRRGGMMTVAIVLTLAVVGTGAAFAYRTYVGSPRSGEPPIIRADAGPTKIVPSPADATSKLPDRMVTGDGAERLVPREGRVRAWCFRRSIPIPIRRLLPAWLPTPCRRPAPGTAPCPAMSPARSGRSRSRATSRMQPRLRSGRRHPRNLRRRRARWLRPPTPMPPPMHRFP